MRDFQPTPAERSSITNNARQLLNDGLSRTAFQIAQEFASRNIVHGTLAITTVLKACAEFRYNSATDTFCLIHVKPNPHPPVPPPSAQQILPKPRFHSLQRIRLRDRPLRLGRIIGEPQSYAKGYQYLVTLNGEESWFAEDDLEELPQDGFPIWQTYDTFLRDLAMIKLKARFTDGLYTYKASRTEFVSYQFRPVLKFLRSSHHRI
jgi:hypothetical protein